MSVAALLKEPERFRGRKTVLVVCGRNIDIERFKKIIGV
jgi:threonine dehydratase